MAQVFSAQTSLSADGVNVILLSANDAAVAYNPVEPLTGLLTTYVLPDGTIILIDDAYINSSMLVLQAPLEAKQFTLITILSGGNFEVTPLSATVGLQVWTPRDRRMHWLGYY